MINYVEITAALFMAVLGACAFIEILKQEYKLSFRKSAALYIAFFAGVFLMCCLLFSLN